MKELLRKAVFNLFTVSLVAIFPAVFMYCQNVQEMQFREVVPFVLICLALSWGLWVLCLLVSRNQTDATLFCIVLVLFVLNYMHVESIVQRVLPNAKFWHIVPTCFIVLGIAFSLLKSYTPEQIKKDAALVVSIAFGAMMVINIIPAVPTIIEKNASGKQNAQTEIVEEGHGPNVYWMIFDECANFPMIEKYYGFDTAPYRQRLETLGIAISDNSKNESASTHVVLTNCMSLDYVVNTETSELVRDELRENSKLVDIFEDYGYRAIGIGETAWLGVNSVNDDNVTEGMTIEGFTASDLLYAQTIVAPFFKKSNVESASLITETFSYLQQKENFVPDNSKFYLTYLRTPHIPFLFDKDGNAVPAHNHANWEEPKYYLEQYQYVMDQTIAALENIIKHDPNAIILAGSDHGPRGYSKFEQDDKTNVMLLGYNQGKPFDELKGKSTVNALRIILNELFDCQFEEVEVIMP